jgi:hypothetical protein
VRGYAAISPLRPKANNGPFWFRWLGSQIICDGYASRIYKVVYRMGCKLRVTNFRLVPMSFQRPPRCANSLQLITGLILLLLGPNSIGLAAPIAACANDRKRLCSPFIGNPSEMQKCIKAHRTEWSASCAAATSKGRANAGDGSRRAKCAEYVQLKYLQRKGAHKNAAPAELKRCMHGEPMD